MRPARINWTSFNWASGVLPPATRIRSRTVVLVFNDNAWGLLRHFQKTRTNQRYIASDLRNPDFTKLAEAYGAHGVQVASLQDLVPALEAALNAETITVIDVLTPDGFAKFT